MTQMQLRKIYIISAVVNAISLCRTTENEDDQICDQKDIDQALCKFERAMDFEHMLLFGIPQEYIHCVIT